MQIDEALATFLSGAVMIIVGTHDGRGRADIARAVGARVDPAAGAVDLVISAWQWPDTAANLRANGRIAATFVRPSDYVSYQLKGRATVRSADARDLALAELYMTGVVAALGAQGVPATLAAPWITSRDAIVARVTVESSYVQTPGPRAGQALVAPA